MQGLWYLLARGERPAGFMR